MMKQHARTLTRVVSLALFAATIAACGGRQTMASKSAAAYDEARRKGLPVSAGSEHGGHSSGAPSESDADHGSMPGMDHAGMPATDSKPAGAESAMEYLHASGGDQAPTAAMDHANMHGAHASGHSGTTHDTTANAHAGMEGMKHGGDAGAPSEIADHAKHGTHHDAISSAARSGSPATSHTSMGHASMDHASTDHAAMGHSAMGHAAMNHAATGHAGMNHAAMAGMPHPTAATALPSPPRTSSAIAATRPDATLRADEFDAAAPISVEESAKASGMVHSMEGKPAGGDPAHPPQPPSQPAPPPALHHHGNGEER